MTNMNFKKNNATKLLLFFSVISVALMSCATLNKDECHSADWKLIGFVDGSKGYPASRIGRHRSACAEYGINPSLDLYSKGRAEGLQQYCVPDKGFYLGRTGSSYNGVCSGNNEVDFIAAFKAGRQLYAAKIKLKKMKKDLVHKQEKLELIVSKISDKEQQIINGKVSKAQVILLLVETKELAIQQGVLLETIHTIKGTIEQQSSYISHLAQQY